MGCLQLKIKGKGLITGGTRSKIQIWGHSERYWEPKHWEWGPQKVPTAWEKARETHARLEAKQSKVTVQKEVGNDIAVPVSPTLCCSPVTPQSLSQKPKSRRAPCLTPHRSPPQGKKQRGRVQCCLSSPCEQKKTKKLTIATKYQQPQAERKQI